MLVTVKYGNDITTPMNGDCAVVNFKLYLLKKMKEANVDTSEIGMDSLELCDMSGILRGARNISGMTNISQILTARESYVPVIVETLQDDETIMNFKLLWTCMSSPPGSMNSIKLNETLSKNLNQSQSRKTRSPNRRSMLGSDRDINQSDRGPGSRAGSRSKRNSVMYTNTSSHASSIRNVVKVTSNLKSQ